ncbi:MAG: glycosyltransferase [Oscillospiraceae bacterium]
MKILMINKFLYPNGGSETYIFKLGDYLKSQGHEVQYFGMEHSGRCVGNNVNAYTADMDFHGGSMLSKLTYPIKTIYSSEARKKLRLVLDDFKPDVCHINNFNYQLTPSIILEIVKWRRANKHKCRIVFTAHDYQLVCPNHMLNNPNTHKNCEKCLGGHYINCLKGKCIHGSTAKSAIGMAEAMFWKFNGAYKYIDKMICCSSFLKTKMDTNPLFAKKTVAMHNFVDRIEWRGFDESKGGAAKKDYVLYFGRFSEEKGIGTLIEVCNELPDVQFIFAGTGPLEEKINGIPNIKNVGFQSGEALEKLIREARFSIYPSEWYENCPFSVMESQLYGTPVLGADIGGIPELIKTGSAEEGATGELFISGNKDDLKNKVEKLWKDTALTAAYAENCKDIAFDTIEEYCSKLMKIYSGNKKKAN